MFDFVEEALDEITFAGESEIAYSLDDAVFFRRDDHIGTAGFDRFNDRVAVIALVAKNAASLDAIQQKSCLREV